MKSVSWITGLAVLILLTTAACGGSTPGAPERTPSSGKLRRKSSHALTSSDLPMLSLNNLTPATGEATKVTRNLFAFEQDPEIIARQKAEAEKRAKSLQKAAHVANIKRQEAIKKQKLNPPKPMPPAIPFKFIGYFGNPDNKIGVFTSKTGDDLYLANKGDTLLAKFNIIEIGYESAEIGFKNFKQTKRIALGGS